MCDLLEILDFTAFVKLENYNFVLLLLSYFWCSSDLMTVVTTKNYLIKQQYCSPKICSLEIVKHFFTQHACNIGIWISIAQCPSFWLSVLPSHAGKYIEVAELFIKIIKQLVPCARLSNVTLCSLNWPSKNICLHHVDPFWQLTLLLQVIIRPLLLLGNTSRLDIVTHDSSPNAAGLYAFWSVVCIFELLWSCYNIDPTVILF